MIGAGHQVRVWACAHPVSMRKSFDGLFAEARNAMGRDPLAGDMFLFVAKNRRQARILRWASDAPNLASPLIPTAFNIGIALGATIGSVTLDRGFGYASLPWIGVVVSLAALAIALSSWSLERRARPAAG